MDRTYESYYDYDDDDETYYDQHVDGCGNSGGFFRTVLDKSSSEYLQVLQEFQKHSATTQFSLKITNIEKVNNADLLIKFQKKAREYKKKYGHYDMVKVFHGTKNSYIPSILENNLQVKFHGRNRGHRFGAGVSFSAWAHYASHYCDETNSQMLLCFVIVSNIIEVPEQAEKRKVLKQPPFIEGLRPLRYDTTAKDKDSMNVIVKFEDNTFYPAFVIHFVKTETAQSSSSPSVGRVSNLPHPRGSFKCSEPTPALAKPHAQSNAKVTAARARQAEAVRAWQAEEARARQAEKARARQAEAVRARQAEQASARRAEEALWARQAEKARAQRAQQVQQACYNYSGWHTPVYDPSPPSSSGAGDFILKCVWYLSLAGGAVWILSKLFPPEQTIHLSLCK